RGIEAFVGDPKLAEFWDENMSLDEIRAEITCRVEQGSTRRLGHMQEFNEASILYKTLQEFFVQWQLWPQVASLHNFLVRSLEKQSTENLEVTQEQLMQAHQMIMM